MHDNSGPLQHLVDEGIIDERQAESIRSSGEVGVWQVIRVLETGADEEVVAEALAAGFDAPRLEVLRAWPDADELADEKLVRLRYCAPLRQLEDGRIVLAMLDPSDRPSIDDVRLDTGCEVVPLTVTRTELETLWDAIYGARDPLREIIATLYLGMTVSEDEQVERLLNMLLLACSKDGASLEIDGEGEEVEITGLCESSTRATDRLLARKFTKRLRAMTDSPPPATLGGLTFVMGRSYDAVHFLVHFSATSTRVEPVEEAIFRTYF